MRKKLKLDGDNYQVNVLLRPKLVVVPPNIRQMFCPEPDSEVGGNSYIINILPYVNGTLKFFHLE